MREQELFFLFNFGLIFLRSDPIRCFIKPSFLDTGEQIPQEQAVFSIQIASELTKVVYFRKISH